MNEEEHTFPDGCDAEQYILGTTHSGKQGEPKVKLLFQHSAKA